jgi:hypothetical protein
LSQPIEVVMFESPQVVLEPSGSINICAGQSQLLDVQASAALSYTWYLDGVEFATDFVNALEVSELGVWTVMISDENGCTAQSEPLYLSVLDVSIPVITAEAATADGQLLMSDDASGHQWFLNGETIAGATGSNYLATENGIYSVISIEDVCESEVSDGFEVILGGVDEGVLIPALYPNPAVDYVVIEHALLSGSTLAVYDMVGQLVLSVGAASSRCTLDVRDLRAGMYRVSTSGGLSASFSVVR